LEKDEDKDPELLGSVVDKVVEEVWALEELLELPVEYKADESTAERCAPCMLEAVVSVLSVDDG